MKFTLKNLAIREKFILFAQRLFDFLLLGNLVFWGGWAIRYVIGENYWEDIDEEMFIIPACCLWIIGGLSTLGIVFRRKELSQKQGFLKFWKSSFLYIAGYFRNAPQEQEGIEPSPRKRLKIKRFIIAGSVLLLLVIGVVLIIQYREKKKESYEVQSRKSGGVTQEGGALMPLTEELYNKLRERGQSDYDIIQRLRQDREDVSRAYDGWLRTEGLTAPEIIQRVIKLDAKRAKSIKAPGITISASDVELFDMRLRGTGGYQALSGRVQNKSATEIEEIRLSITLYNLARKPIDSGTATISCSIPPFAVRSVTGDVTEMTPPEPLKEPVNDYFAEREKRIKDGWEYTRLGLVEVVWQKKSWKWNYQILSVTGRKGQLGSK